MVTMKSGWYVEDTNYNWHAYTLACPHCGSANVNHGNCFHEAPDCAYLCMDCGDSGATPQGVKWQEYRNVCRRVGA